MAGAPNPIMNAALTSGGEFVDAREAKRAAEARTHPRMRIATLRMHSLLLNSH